MLRNEATIPVNRRLSSLSWQKWRLVECFWQTYKRNFYIAAMFWRLLESENIVSFIRQSNHLENESKNLPPLTAIFLAWRRNAWGDV